LVFHFPDLRLGPSFSMYCIFRPCDLARHFQVLHLTGPAVAPATSWIAPVLELRRLTVASHLKGLPVGVLDRWIYDVSCWYFSYRHYIFSRRMNSDNVLKYGVMRRIYILIVRFLGGVSFVCWKGVWHFFLNSDVIFLHKKDDSSDQVFTSLVGVLDFIFSYFVQTAKLYLQWYSSPKMVFTDIPSAKMCVCVPVTRRYCVKTATHRIMQIMPHNNPGNLFFSDAKGLGHIWTE